MAEVDYDRLRPGAGGDQGTGPLQDDMNRVTTFGEDSCVDAGIKLKVLAMAFKTDGFLSPTMEDFRTSLREVPA